jgi:2-polyprenyl-6-methoxyphenol hydroxylase-like FAD-dependent oxidoreductase
MPRHAAVIGGSIAGLAAAVALARRGWRVTVVERDVAPATHDGDAAFVAWDRRHVPQFRHPHAFSARSRNLLLAHVPEAVELMLADGIEEINLFTMLAPPEYWVDGDDAYTMLWSRRPGFELAIRRVAEAEPGVAILAPQVASGLLADGGATPVHVTGVRLADGTRVEADVVIDAAGRRSPVPKWLAALGVEVPHQVQDCGGVYHTCYYRLRSSEGAAQFAILTLREAIESVGVIGFPGDHGTYALAAFVRTGDDDLRVLRHDWAWNAVLGAIPRAARWAHPDIGAPLTSVQSMGGHQNMRAHYVVDGRPVVHGVLPVGDALCTTNPLYGWGASMALTYAFAVVDALSDHPDDAEAGALAYDDAVRDEADGVYRESAAMDRARSYRWTGEPVPEWDRAEVERQDLIECVIAGALHDPVLGRAQLRRGNLLQSPAAILDDPEVVRRAKHTQEILAAKADRQRGPSRDDLLAAIADARGRRGVGV